jgi:hypothetical protein
MIVTHRMRLVHLCYRTIKRALRRRFGRCNPIFAVRKHHYGISFEMAIGRDIEILVRLRVNSYAIFIYERDEDGHLYLEHCLRGDMNINDVLDDLLWEINSFLDF